MLAILSPSAARATDTTGLTVTGYVVTELPPIKSDDVYESCGTEQVPFINATFDYPETVFADCGWDWFMLHYTGSIEIPEHESIQLMVAADDGGTVKIGVHEFGDWNMKGCSWSEPISPVISAGVYDLDAWFYEAGGATCFMLAWQIDNGDWTIVPPSAFTSTPTPTTTTTTTTSTTTTTTTTTTLPEVTTTWVTTTESTTTTTTSTTTAPTTTVLATTIPTTTVQSTTTTQPEVIWVPPATTTTEATTTTTEPPTTTTAVDTTVPVVTEPVTLPTVVETTLPTPVETTIPEVQPDDLIIDEPVQDQPVDEPVLDELQPNEAIGVATSAQVLNSLSATEAAEVFAAIDLDEASPEQIEALVEAVQDAPAEVREAFETEINIFDGKTDTYVPLGSAISVGARRVLVAATAIVIAVPMSSPSHTSRKNG